jgi:fatty acid desaturase
MVNSVTSSESDITRYLDDKRPWWDILAILYTFLGYGVGIALILLPQWWVNLLGTLLLSHSLVISAYLIHECVHGTIFRDRQNNARLGAALAWLNGGCYFRFKDLTRLHIAHHTERADFSDVDFMQRLPGWCKAMIYALEWCHIPAVDYAQRWRSLTSPFWSGKRQDERWRTVLLLLLRSSFFLGLGLVSWKALLLYSIAYTGMVIVLRWMDAFQHIYDTYDLGESVTKRDRQYERTYTFSTLVSQRYPWLNLLTLNFGYHNAHHELMACSWYHLPALDQEIPDRDRVHYLSFWDLLKNYHRFRMNRLQDCSHDTALDQHNQLHLDEFYGGIGVSFLVLPISR